LPGPKQEETQTQSAPSGHVRWMDPLGAARQRQGTLRQGTRDRAPSTGHPRQGTRDRAPATGRPRQGAFLWAESSSVVRRYCWESLHAHGQGLEKVLNKAGLRSPHPSVLVLEGPDGPPNPPPIPTRISIVCGALDLLMGVLRIRTAECSERSGYSRRHLPEAKFKIHREKEKRLLLMWAKSEKDSESCRKATRSEGDNLEEEYNGGERASDEGGPLQ